MYDVLGYNSSKAVESRVFGTALTAYAFLATAAGAIWIGKTVGAWIAWLLDEEGYWSAVADDARTELAEAESKLDEIRNSIAVAEREDPNAIITDDPNAGGNHNSAWF